MTAIVDAGYGDVKAPAPAPREKMNHANAYNVGRRVMPAWSKYNLLTVVEVYRRDREYLAWLVDKNEWKLEIEAYLDYMDKRGTDDE